MNWLNDCITRTLWQKLDHSIQTLLWIQHANKQNKCIRNSWGIGWKWALLEYAYNNLWTGECNIAALGPPGDRFAVPFGAIITAVGFLIYASFPPAITGKPGSLLWDVAAKVRILSGAGVTSETSGHGLICGSWAATWVSMYITQSGGKASGTDLQEFSPSS